MNDAVVMRLQRLNDEVNKIKSACERIMMDIADVEESEDLPIIENNFDFIRRTASDAMDFVRNTYDEFEEEE